MNSQKNTDRFTTHLHRPIILVNYLLFIAFILRRKNDVGPGTNIPFLLVLVFLFALLFASEPLLSPRIKSFHRIYFIVQLVIIQILGTVKVYQDTWALLYIILAFQVVVRCSRKEAVIWLSLFAVSLLITLSAEFGFVSGFGRAMAYGMIGTLIVSYDIQYAQHEDTLAESQMLLAELQEAHQKLIEYAAQAEELATAQQRNQMIKELYDSVGQKVFAIQLAAETARLMLSQHPQRAVEQVSELQVQTQSALSQMRQLIDQWRPV